MAKKKQRAVTKGELDREIAWVNGYIAGLTCLTDISARIIGDHKKVLRILWRKFDKENPHG